VMKAITIAHSDNDFAHNIFYAVKIFELLWKDIV
jgi:hypothetical protein